MADYTPVAVGAGVGLLDGLVGQIPSLAAMHYSHTAFRLLAFATGVAGEFLDWPEDINYALMTASTALVSSRLPAALSSGAAGFTDLVKGGASLVPVAVATL